MPYHQFYYDKQGNPITGMKMTKLWMDQSYRIVQRTELDQVYISTVWVGMDLSFGLGPPLIFETMVFGFEDEWCDRYSSELEALKGHFRMLKRVLIKLGNENSH